MCPNTLPPPEFMIREDQAMSEDSTHSAQLEEWLGVKVCMQRWFDRPQVLIKMDVQIADYTKMMVSTTLQ